MQLTIKRNGTIYEFLRYAFVGGISAVIDLAVLWAMTEFVFHGKNTGVELAISTTAGFLVGLSVNYSLSLLFVFIKSEQQKRGKSFKAFLIYAAVGVVGWGLTVSLMEIGMLFVSKESLWYLLLSCFVKGIVLIYNYLGRKIFVFRGI